MANNKKVNGIAKNIQDLFNGLYKSTYYSNDDNKKLLDNTMDQIDGTIYNLLNKIENNTGRSNISSLYLRMQNSQKVKKDGTAATFEKIFGDEVLMDGLLNAYSQNKYILDLDNEIDTVCRYMTQLEEALDAIKDNILSSDNFNKDYLNIMDKGHAETEMFSSDIDEIKTAYHITEKLETYIDDILKYGEHFTYIVPYEKAFNKLLGNNDLKIENGDIIAESGPVTHIFKMDSLTESEIDVINKIKINIKFQNHIVNESVVKMKMGGKLVPDDLEISVDKDLYSDGLINKDDDKIKGMTGCYIRELNRANVIPLYIDDICLGYYYIEAETDVLSSMNMDTKLNSLTLRKTNDLVNKEIQQRDNIIKTIASKLSTVIDKKFINANQDLKEELYLILKYNMTNGNENSLNSLKVTYIPPEDMMHWYFKKDPKTHRGISALSRALFPAKLYSCLYITSVIGVLTRGQDKRVYYVKQNIDTNISETLLSTINQIKKSNFGLREINNLSNVLNITGKFNDYVIPVGQSGDAPIQFEIMQGQDIPVKTELMELLESMAVNSIGVPLDIIQNRRNADYALRLSMTSSKFQRHSMKLQLRTEIQTSIFITLVYNYHFAKNSKLVVELPPPSYLALQNTLSLLQNNVDYLNTLTSVMFTDDDPAELKLTFQRKYLKKKLNSHLDMDMLEELLKQARLEFKQKSSDVSEEDI